MQKQLSKHSLLVLSLSILLAISMCLTATFAAFAKQSTVTGTVTFVDGIEMRANTSGSGAVLTGDVTAYVISFQINMANNTKTQVTTGLEQGVSALTDVFLSANGANYFWKATLTLANASYVTFDTAANSTALGAIAMGNVTPTVTSSTVITWNKGSTPVAGTETQLAIDDVIAALPTVINYSAIGAAESAPTVTVTLALQAAYSQIA